MKMQSLIKKRLIVFCSTLLVIIILTISSTFALVNNDITKTDIQENTNKLVLKYRDEGTSIKTGLYPMTKEYGLEESPINRLQIQNKDKQDSEFSLMLFPKDISENSISVDKVYYSVNGEEPRILGDSLDYVVYRGTISGNDKENLTIQIWLSAERVENDDQGKPLNLDFKILNY